MGGLRRDRRQSDQYRPVSGGDEQRVEIERRWAVTKVEKEKDEEKMAVAKEPTGWIQDIAPPGRSFLRRKVARRVRQLVPAAKILFFSVESDIDLVIEALNLGAAYVHKSRARCDLLPALEAVLWGRAIR